MCKIFYIGVSELPQTYFICLGFAIQKQVKNPFTLGTIFTYDNLTISYLNCI